MPARQGERPPSVWWVVTGAVLLRLALMLGRGDYVAFDEGWYLLLGQSLWSGNGYTLSGLPHVALSPLFPIVSGAVGLILGDAIWAGRLVAAVAAGLLVLPCWSIFRRLAGERVAYVGAVLVAVMPSLAPFVVPYWIGWDLWVGAEPLLHLFLFTGMALFLRAWESGSKAAAVGCGASFSLAYLARPEALGPFGTLAVLALGLGILQRARGSGPERTAGEKVTRPARRSLACRGGNARPVSFILCAAAFVVVAGPYWLYLQEATGRWTITGRWVQVMPSRSSGPGASPARPANRIEDMLWRGDESAYVRALYSLDPSGTRLANGYWGVQPAGASGAAVPERAAEPSASAPGTTPAEGTPETTVPSPAPDSWLRRYATALGVAVPWYVWVFALPGVLVAMPGRRLDLEALVAVPLAMTSVLIVRIVAIDPRTQLFIAPLVAFYAARGVLWVADTINERLDGVRPGLAPKLVVGALTLALLTTSLADLTLSLTVGSPHHVVAEQNRAVGEAIREATPEDAAVVSFHPAIALFAERDWRVLPLEPMPRIVRYARTLPDPYLVLSVFYPPQVRPLEEPHYLVVPVPPDTPDHDRWRIDVPTAGTILAFGRLAPFQEPVPAEP